MGLLPKGGNEDPGFFHAIHRGPARRLHMPSGKASLGFFSLDMREMDE